MDFDSGEDLFCGKDGVDDSPLSSPLSDRLKIRLGIFFGKWKGLIERKKWPFPPLPITLRPQQFGEGVKEIRGSEGGRMVLATAVLQTRKKNPS